MVVKGPREVAHVNVDDLGSMENCLPDKEANFERNAGEHFARFNSYLLA